MPQKTVYSLLIIRCHSNDQVKPVLPSKPADGRSEIAAAGGRNCFGNSCRVLCLATSVSLSLVQMLAYQVGPAVAGITASTPASGLEWTGGGGHLLDGRPLQRGNVVSTKDFPTVPASAGKAANPVPVLRGLSRWVPGTRKSYRSNAFVGSEENDTAEQRCPLMPRAVASGSHRVREPGGKNGLCSCCFSAESTKMGNNSYRPCFLGGCSSEPGKGH